MNREQSTSLMATALTRMETLLFNGYSDVATTWQQKLECCVLLCTSPVQQVLCLWIVHLHNWKQSYRVVSFKQFYCHTVIHGECKGWRMVYTVAQANSFKLPGCNNYTTLHDWQTEFLSSRIVFTRSQVSNQLLSLAVHECRGEPGKTSLLHH